MKYYSIDLSSRIADIAFENEKKVYNLKGEDFYPMHDYGMQLEKDSPVDLYLLIGTLMELNDLRNLLAKNNITFHSLFEIEANKRTIRENTIEQEMRETYPEILNRS